MYRILSTINWGEKSLLYLALPASASDTAAAVTAAATSSRRSGVRFHNSLNWQEEQENRKKERKKEKRIDQLAG